MNARYRLTSFLLFMLFVAGCQRPGGSVPVSGRVTFRGMTLNNGMVVFTPDSTRGESGPIAMGTIQRDGTYSLITDDKPGAQAGYYRITVISFDVPPSPQGGVSTAVPILPEKYLDPNQSQLTCQVLADHKNNFDLELDPRN